MNITGSRGLGPSTVREFISFLDTNDVILGAATFILAISANDILSELIDETIEKPLQQLTGFEDRYLLFGDIRIRHGRILLQIVGLISSAFVIFIIVKLAKLNLGFV